jgi:hypothetical protein
MKSSFESWITESISNSTSIWVALTFRVDGYVLNGHQQMQSCWKNDSTCIQQRVTKALEWTITEFRRKFFRKMRFAAFWGGDSDIGIFPHIHAVLEAPIGTTREEIQTYLSELWGKKLAKTLRCFVNSSVYVEGLHFPKKFIPYCIRYEGKTFSLGDEKVIVNKSFNF